MGYPSDAVINNIAIQGGIKDLYAKDNAAVANKMKGSKGFFETLGNASSMDYESSKIDRAQSNILNAIGSLRDDTNHPPVSTQEIIALIQGQLQLRSDLHGRQHAGRAAHVVLHLVHALARLERDATRIKRDALANQHHGRLLGRAALVAQHDELRRLFAALGHGQEGAHLQGFDLLAAEHFDLELEFLGDLARGVGQVRRRADVGGEVAEVLRDAHAGGYRLRPARRDFRRVGQQLTSRGAGERLRRAYDASHPRAR